MNRGIPFFSIEEKDRGAHDVPSTLIRKFDRKHCAHTVSALHTPELGRHITSSVSFFFSLDLHKNQPKAHPPS
jgi:hypothetical protein